MTSGFIWIFLLGILVVAVLVLVVIVMTRRGPLPLDREKYQCKWLEIERSLTRDNQASYHLAVLNADKLLDQALKEKRLPGESMGQRMKSAEKFWSNANSTWSAHKLRNQIAHETDINVSYDTIKRVMAAFKQSLKDLGAI